MSPLKKLKFGLTLFLGTFVLSALGYRLSGWSTIDSVYMVVITIFGVGYGEVRPLESPQMKVFTMCVIVAGASAGVYSLGAIMQLVTQGEIQRAMGARRMRNDIDHLERHTIVCGFGRIGQVLAAELSAGRCPFVVLDTDPARVAAARDRGYLAMEGNASDEEALQAAGVDRAKVLATVLPNDALNVFITLSARNLSPSLYIIARGEYPATHTKLLQAGANQVVLPTMIGAQRIAGLIRRPAAGSLLGDADNRNRFEEDLQHLGVTLQEVTLAEGSPLVGKAVGDVEVKGQGTFLVVAVRREGGQTVPKPPADTVLSAGDTVVLMGHGDQLPAFVERNVLPKAGRYRGALRG
jgi:voltage-gated potassium channel